jgi:hypothetical protein
VAIRAVEGGEEQFEILGPVQLGKDLEMDAISECEEREFSFVWHFQVWKKHLIPSNHVRK